MLEKVTFVKITKKNEHITYLYEYLKEREFNVSNTKLPSFDEHRNFVLNHPYRVWLLIKVSSNLVGNVYLHQDNTIGLHLHKNYSKFIPIVLEKLFSEWEPLPEIKSVRNSKFLINVASADENTGTILEEFGARKIQTTYLFD